MRSLHYFLMWDPQHTPWYFASLSSQFWFGSQFGTEWPFGLNGLGTHIRLREVPLQNQLVWGGVTYEVHYLFLMLDPQQSLRMGSYSFFYYDISVFTHFMNFVNFCILYNMLDFFVLRLVCLEGGLVLLKMENIVTIFSYGLS